ncbi:unnamed protein product [Durusdinium trenchii]|uniref:Cytochrome b5 heme-binding domain-containing protein n=1 Tax=Durusdinium trenchii TaxID=1381693 RepID=A0ABP0Q7F8_9DINO
MWRVASVVACFAVLAYFLQPSDRRRKDAPDVTPTESGEANSSKSKSGKGQKTKGPPYPRLPAEDRNASAVPVWTVHRLAEHSGSDRTRPLLLAILGEVYDVGPGERHYGPDAGYSGMAGKDASRSFTTGDFKKDAVPGLRDLPPEQLADVISCGLRLALLLPEPQRLSLCRPLLLSVLTWEMALEHRKGTGAPNLEPVLASGLLVLCFSSLVQVDHFHALHEETFSRLALL